MWQNLIATIQEMLSIYRVLLEKSRQKKDALIHNQVPELEKISAEEESLILQIGRLEHARKEQVENIAQKHGVAEEFVTLVHLCKSSAPETAAELEKLETDFRQIVEELKNLNVLNTQLLEQALSIVNYTINVLAQSEAGPNYTGRSGMQEQIAPVVQRVFDAKV